MINMGRYTRYIALLGGHFVRSKITTNSVGKIDLKTRGNGVLLELFRRLNKVKSSKKDVQALLFNLENFEPTEGWRKI